MPPQLYAVKASAVRRLHEDLAHLDEREARATNEHRLVRESLKGAELDPLNWAYQKSIQKSLAAAAKRVHAIATEAAYLRKFLKALGLEVE